MEIIKFLKCHKKSVCILAGLLLFFLGISLTHEVGVYNDSEQYISMHIHREPLYPLFLAFFRLIGGEGYLKAAAAVQGILTACGIWALSEYLAKRFSLSWPAEITIVILQVMPHIVTRYVSAYGIFLENSVMSEALCIPLFQFYVLFLLRMVFGFKKKDIVGSLLMAFLLSLTRGQMMSTILIWLVIAALQLAARKKYRVLAVPVVTVVGVFALRSLSIHVYNYGVTGYFMGNTFGPVNVLTNVMYACDEEDGEVFEEGSLEKYFFDRFYAKADAIGANYKYGGDNFSSQARHLEENHDTLKFDVLEAEFGDYYFGQYELNYYEENRRVDAISNVMIKKLLPVVFWQWLLDYIRLCTRGFIRSIAVVHPLVNWVVLLLYAAAAGLCVWKLSRKEKEDAVYVMGVALLFIAANVCATSLTIMCLSRYMIYGFAPFYIALFLFAVEGYRDRKRKTKDRVEENHGISGCEI